jgi:T4 bacteriophage base plate protein
MAAARNDGGGLAEGTVSRLLSAYDIVRICEWGRDKHALDRALVLLRAAVTPAHPDPDVLARLPIGRRDALLLALRARTFGPTLELTVRCPSCAEALEFTHRAEDLTVPPPGDGSGGTLVRGGFSIVYRLPDSLDLASVARVRDPLEARNRLLQRCVVSVHADGEARPLSSVPEEVLAALAARLAEDDPQADITFRLRCLTCRHEWVSPFDIVSFFWAELEAHARQLAREVHGIAKAYGWTEPYILSMGAARRAHYLELSRGG